MSNQGQQDDKQGQNDQQQQYNTNNLAYGMQNMSLGGNAPAFNPAAPNFVPNMNAQTFNPGQYGQYGQQQYGQYGQNQYGQYGQYSNNSGGKQGYNGYNNQQYNNQYGNQYGQRYGNQYGQQYGNQYGQQYGDQNNGNESHLMSLDDYKKQKQQQTGTAKPKKKKTLKLNLSSSTIKIGNSKKVEKKTVKPEAPKVEKPKEAKPEKASPKAVNISKSTSSAPKSSAENSTSITDNSNVQKSISSKPTDDSSLKEAADIARDQEDHVDPEVVKDMFGGKPHVSIIFMGHVDAGKSTMGGNLLSLTGAVDKRIVEKYEKEAKDAGRQGWYLSWIMDTDKEERSDGKTIETGKAYFETDTRRYTILDAPGHRLYVSEMIGSASQADVGILVISARKGEYEAGFERGGQSREHAMLAKTQGVNRLVVVINKMDDPTVNWSEKRYKECTKKLSVFLKNIGYSGKNVFFMPVSGYTGDGLKARIPEKICPWYRGPSLLEYLDAMPLTARKINDPFMLPIASKLKDMGTIVEGKIESGHVRKNQEILLMPNKIDVEVLTIFNETEEEADAAFCGEQVRMKLKGVNEDDINAGYVLTSKEHPVHTVTKFVAQVALVELKSILSAGFSCVMHVHTAVEEVTFTKLLHKLEKGTNRKSKRAPAFAKKGMKIIAVLETENPICVETYKNYPELGRFTLRDQGETIAIGKIVKLL